MARGSVDADPQTGGTIAAERACGSCCRPASGPSIVPDLLGDAEDGAASSPWEAEGCQYVIVKEQSGTLTTSDGRVIAWVDGADPNGYPVIGLHGTPGCRLSRWPDDSVYAEAGVRYVTTDRAGYGLSSRHRGRSVADEARDVLAVADALEFHRFAVVGGSGGGPHALACAALLPGRVERVACQSSLAPLGERGLARTPWLAGMEEENAAELTWAEAGEDVLTREMERAQRLMTQRLADDPGTMLGEGAPPGDVAFLRRPDVVAALSRIVVEQARNGVGGSVDDTLAFAQDWGFNLASITVPVLLTYGDTDTSCPVAHGRFLAAAIPTATVAETAGGGHLPSDPRNEILTTHKWLRTGSL
jgi:pimeloyl-ACP methyl ester carboxylesterase